MSDVLVSQKNLLRDLGNIERPTMYEEQFRKGYLHCLSICKSTVARANAVNPVVSAGGVYCWGCDFYNKEKGVCVRRDPPESVSAQSFCSFGKERS